MANKLKLALSSAAPEGDVVDLFLIGTNATIIPHLDKTAAAERDRDNGRGPVYRQEGQEPDALWSGWNLFADWHW